MGKVHTQWLLTALSVTSDHKQPLVIRAQIPNIWRARFFLFTLTTKAVCKLFQEHIHNCLLCDWGGEYVTATVVRAEIKQNSLSKTSLEVASLQQTPVSQKMVTPDRFCQCDCCLSGRKISGASYPPSLQNHNVIL